MQCERIREGPLLNPSNGLILIHRHSRKGCPENIGFHAEHAHIPLHLTLRAGPRL